MAEACLGTIREFLAQKRIAVVGASRNPRDFNAALFRTFRNCGYDVVPVNPKAQEIEGARCFACLQDVAPRVDAALLLTPSDVTPTVVNDSAEAGIGRVWMYRAGGRGAVNPAAVELCGKKGIAVVPGYCPLMFMPGVSWFHRLHGFVMKVARQYPR